MIQKKQCYKNVFRILTETKLFFEHPKWFVAFGYISFDSKLFTKHCFIYDAENKAVIDFTLPANDATLLHHAKI
jgi:hypothetical protein